jgi:hypothetical protein
VERRNPLEQEKFGIYVNPKESKVVRVNSPYWIPSEPDWVYLTPDVNTTLLKIRELAAERKLVDEPDKLMWS